MNLEFREAARRRSQSRESSVPAGNARALPFSTQMRAEPMERDGKQLYRVEGYASAFNQPYEMWDFAGPYYEIVEPGAADLTLRSKPDVSFLVNHRGVTMARTTNGTLELYADAKGLRDVAYLNAERHDVKDLVIAINDQNITEQSFAFMIDEGTWNEDFTEFRIKRFDLNRGDVSAVNYGANPYTSIAARSHEIMRELDELPAGAARAALIRLQNRTDLGPVRTLEPTTGGRSLRSLEALLSLNDIR